MKTKLFPLLLLLLFQTSFAQTIEKIDSINNINVHKMDIPIDEMIGILKQNIKDAKQINYLEGQAETYKKLSIAYTYEGDNQDKSVEAIFKAINIYEKLNKKDKQAQALGELGFRMKRRDLEKAMYYMQKGLKIAETNNFKSELKDLYNNYGVLKQWNKEIDSAIYYFKSGLDIKKQQDDRFGIPYSLSNLAGAYLKKNDYDKASSLLKESIQLRIQLEDSIGLGENYTQLAEVYYAEERFDEALNLFKKSTKIARLKEYKLLEQFAYDYISKVYQQKNQADSALYYYKKHVEIKENMFTEKQEAKIAELNIAYETEKKESQIAQSKLKIQRKNTLLYGAFGSVILLGIIGYLVYNQQRTKNNKLKKEMELKTALAKIETQNKLEEQRLRISGDLHDNIGSQLTFVISGLQYIQYQKKMKIDEVKTKLEQISEFTQQTIFELRDTIWAMNKEKIQLSDMINRLNNFTNQLDVKENLTVSVSNNLKNNIDDFVFSALSGIQIYRVIQESINNAIKHAHAENININLDYNNDDLKIKIKDDGSGFDIDLAKAGNGLSNMKKRAEKLKAEYNIISTKNEGTTISLSINLKHFK